MESLDSAKYSFIYKEFIITFCYLISSACVWFIDNCPNSVYWLYEKLL